MQINVRHRTRYTYDEPAKSVLQVLRMTPRNHEGQFIRAWRLEVDEDAVLRAGEDSFGNITHMISLTGPIDTLTITLEGTVETADTNGIVRDAIERFPVRLYLRQTPLTMPNPVLVDYARTAVGGIAEPLEQLHALLAAIHRDVMFDTSITTTTTTAAESFAMKRGVCQDLAHIFVVCARELDIPARYVGGHLWRIDGATQQPAGHAWAEAYVSGLGWVGFDPANGICITDAHVRVSAGLDYLGAAPVRGTRFGGESENLTVSVQVEQAMSQRQG